MTKRQLSTLQLRVLELLAGLEPTWTLVGGGALIGFHLGHRETRALDLFFRPLLELGRVVPEVTARLVGAGLQVQTLQGGATFTRLLVRSPQDQVVLDLVADPVMPIEPAREYDVGETRVSVDTARSILVAKLCTLPSRVELRDLVDVKALLDSGLELEDALARAPDLDGGFSVPLLGWSLQALPIEKLSDTIADSGVRTDELLAFRNALVARLLALARPDD